MNKSPKVGNTVRAPGIHDVIMSMVVKELFQHSKQPKTYIAVDNKDNTYTVVMPIHTVEEFSHILNVASSKRPAGIRLIAKEPGLTGVVISKEAYGYIGPNSNCPFLKVEEETTIGRAVKRNKLAVAERTA